MSFSILFAEDAEPLRREIREEPAFFRDLNLDQIVETITAGKQEYDLKPFFYIALPDAEAVRYCRHTGAGSVVTANTSTTYGFLPDVTLCFLSSVWIHR